MTATHPTIPAEEGVFVDKSDLLVRHIRHMNESIHVEHLIQAAPVAPVVGCCYLCPSYAGVVWVLQDRVGSELDVLLAPLRGSVVAGDDPHPMDARVVAEDEGVAALDVFVCAVGEAEMPVAVLVPGVGLEVTSAVGGGWLDVSSAASEDAAADVDEVVGVVDRSVVDSVLRHALMVA